MDVQGNKFYKDFANKDLFPRLTDDLLILILSMVSCDLRFLCQCMLISKRFALLIPLISAGTLTIPQPQDKSPLKHFQIQVDYVFDALKTFKKIRSLHLIFMKKKCKNFNFQWKAVLGSNTSTCACLIFDSITKLSPANASAGFSATTATNNETLEAKVHGPIMRRIMFPYLWRNLFAVFQLMVENVVISDSERQGKVCFRNTELRDAKTYTSSLDVWWSMFEEDQTSIRFFYAPELRLLKSEFLMNGVFLAISKIGGNSVKDKKYDDMLKCDFGEEQKVFGEALQLILRTPDDRLIEYGQHDQGIFLSFAEII